MSQIQFDALLAVAVFSAFAFIVGTMCFLIERPRRVEARKIAQRDRDIALGLDIGRKLAPSLSVMIRELAAQEVEAREAERFAAREAHAAQLAALGAAPLAQAAPEKRRAMRDPATGRFLSRAASLSAATAH